MTQATIKCISLIDDSVYAEEPLADKHTALTKIAAARLAQQNWAARPLSERVDLVRKGLEQLCAMASEVTLDPALCWSGRKNTGRGGALSIIGYHNLTRPKSYNLKKQT